MLKNFFGNQTKTITSAAIILGAASLVSRLLGILRDRVLAGEFGASQSLDIYYAAFRIPDFLFNMLVLGALSAGFIPVFVDYLDSKKKAWELVNIVLNLMLLSIILISGLLFVIAPWLTKIVAPGFSGSSAVMATDLTRIMLLAPVLLGISGIFSSVLQSYRHFFIYSLAPILYNIGLITGALFFVPVMGLPGLAWGVVLGAGLHMLIQLVAVLSLGYRYAWTFDLNHKGVVQILKIMGPRVFGLLTTQLNFLVVTIIGSTLMVGSITIFNFALNIQSFPLGIFAVSFAIAAFPALAEVADKKSKFISTLSLATRQILFLIIPSSALLIILRAQIVRIILGAGLFSWEDTVLTLQVLSLFSVSLFAQSLILLFTRAFYARQDSKTPFYVGLISVLANIVLSLMLSESLGVLGLALAFSLSSILNFILLIIFLHYQLGNLDGNRIILSTGKIIIATFALSVVAQAIKYPLEQAFGTSTLLGVGLQGMAAVIGGGVTYILVLYILKSEELTIFLNSFKKKLGAYPMITEEIIEQEKLT